MKAFFSTIMSGLIILLVVGFLFPAGFVSADDGNLCEVDADVVLVLDVSGSMEDGGAQSKCEWSEIKEYGGNYTWFLNTKYNVSDAWCSNVRDSFDESVPNFQFAATSYTAATNSKITDAKNAAKLFIDNLKSQDQSGLVTFSTDAQLVKSLSSDHNATKTDVDAAVTGGFTNIGDAIAFAIAEFNGNANPQATKTIILLTDGKANKPPLVQDPEAYAVEKAQIAANLGYKIFTIGLGSDGDINAQMLQDIANITGAQYYHANNGSELSGIYDQISVGMCQYGSISGCKYGDLNNDEIIDAEEPKLSGWGIVLSGTTIFNQSTDENGCYTFAGLLEGDYIISEAENTEKLPFTNTYPASPYSRTLAYGENLTDYNFANYLPVCGNSILDSAQSEQCDDGNTANGDGCSSTCQIEQIPEGIQAGDIVINEIMQNPKGVSPNLVSDTTGEWFEVYNTTDSPIELSGCVIEDLPSGSNVIGSLVVPAHGYAILARSANLSTNGGITPDYVYGSALYLGNSSDQITLTCSSVEIDRVAYDSSFPLADGASMDLASPSLDNNIGVNWCTSTTTFGAGDKGTPGTANDSCGGGGITYYTIAASSGANGSISPSGAISVASGSNQTFNITSDPGYQVADVLVDGVTAGAVTTYTFSNVLANHSISASFSAIGGGVINYTISASAGTNGSITPSGAVIVPSGSSQTFTIAPNPGYQLADLLVDALSVASPSASYVFTNVTSDHSISASFSAITIQYSPPTAVPIAGTYTSVQNVTLIAAGGFPIIHYTTNGTDPTCSTGNVFSSAISVATNLTIKAISCYSDGASSVASFAYTINIPQGGGGGSPGLPAHIIVASSGSNGSISPLGATYVSYGSSQTFNITPNSGYAVADVLVDGASAGALTTYTFSNVTADRTISVSFSAAISGSVAGAEALYIFDEELGNPLETSVIMTWKTNLPATSRVVCDTVSHSEAGTAPNYGYSFSTEYNSEKVTYHVILISGLQSDAIYYCRPVSSDSAEVTGKELSFTTKESFWGTGVGAPLDQPVVAPGGQQQGAGESGNVLGETMAEETVTEENQEITIQLPETPEPFLAGLGTTLGNIFSSKIFVLFFIIAVIILLILFFPPIKNWFKKKEGV